MKKSTSMDVARLAGVSRSTVSFVLNRSEQVAISDATKERVFAAAHQLGYRPNAAGRMLVRGDSETIGLIVTDPNLIQVAGFLSMVLQSVIGRSQEYGYRVILDFVGHDPHHSYTHLVQGGSIDGLIVINPRADDSELIDLIERDFPLVLLGSVRHPREHSVNFSTRRAIHACMEYLHGLGHRSIAHVTFSPEGFVATDARLQSYREALAKLGLPNDPSLVAFANYSSESGHAATLELLDRGGAPTAILAGNDTISVGVLRAVTERGLRVPQDISVIGFDDLPISPYLNPPLTTIKHRPSEQARLAVEMLMSKIRGVPVRRPRTAVPTELVIRESTGPAKDLAARN